MIIFNEKEYVEDHYLNKKNEIRYESELYMVVRYFIFKGTDVFAIRSILNSMDCSEIIKHYIDDNYIFTSVIMKAQSRKLREGEPIPITKYEYDFVRSVGDVEKEKILFTLLVVQKLIDSNIFNVTFKNIKKMSLTQKGKRELQVALKELETDGYINIVDWRKYKINLDKLKNMKSNVYLLVDDIERPTAPYLRTLKTDDFFFCEWCGRKIKRKKGDSHAKKYCKRCSEIQNKNRSKTNILV